MSERQLRIAECMLSQAEFTLRCRLVPTEEVARRIARNTGKPMAECLQIARKQEDEAVRLGATVHAARERVAFWQNEVQRISALRNGSEQ